MTTKMDAVYEDGKLVLPTPLPLPDKARVVVTIESGTPSSDAERDAWLSISEQSLLRTWDNPEDDIFNELLSK